MSGSELTADDRVIAEVPPPPRFPLSKEQLFSLPNGLPDLKLLKEHLLREGRLAQDCATEVINQATAVFKSEPNVLELKYPVTVCGDVHGQYFDLVRLFEVGGDPSETQYLFLGDYVDRGCFSSECVFYLYCLKITYPKSFFLLRGNHECRQLTEYFNFKDECAFKYNLDTYDSIMSSFDHLPLAAVVNKVFFCVHGGLSPDVGSLEDIRTIDRFQEIPRSGPMCDILWSDPFENDTPPEDSTQANWFTYNETRQCSVYFGVEAVKKFLKENKFTSIIRAHEAQEQGYKMHMLNQGNGIPRVITIFSAPNYCDAYNNKAACLKFDNNVLNIKQFVDSPHPYYLPNFMDVFQWSLPFVAEKLTDMLANMLAYSGDEELQAPVEAKSVVEQRGGLLKKKVLAVTKLMRVYRTLREQNEAIVKLKQLVPGNKVPFGLLRAGNEAIQQALSNFSTAQKADAANEAMPSLQVLRLRQDSKRKLF